MIGEADAYIEALIKEAHLQKEYFNKHIVDTVFIGGGTPSILTSGQFEKIISGLRNVINIAAEEFSIEANPETIVEEKVKIYAKAGVNRISIGMQSHDNSVLEAIGRRHTYEDFLKAYNLAKNYIGNVNVDTIFGLPGQSVENYKETINRLIDLAPQHVSCYSLKLEEGTKLYSEYRGIEDDTDRQMYHYAVNLLTAAGYRHYETSNFAQPGYECKHNLKYWNGSEYIGLGIAASSYDINSRSTNTTGLHEYIEEIAKDKMPIMEKIDLSLNDREQEYIMLHQRLAVGISFEEFKKSFKKDFMIEYKQPVLSSMEEGLISVDNKGIYPTLKGFDLQNILILKFMKNM